MSNVSVVCRDTTHVYDNEECPHCRIAQLEQEKAILKEDFAGLQGRIEQVVDEYEANQRAPDCVYVPANRTGSFTRSTCAAEIMLGFDVLPKLIERGAFCQGCGGKVTVEEVE